MAVFKTPVANLAVLVVALTLSGATGAAVATTGVIPLGGGVTVEPTGGAEGGPALVGPPGSDLRGWRNIQGRPGVLDIASGHRRLPGRVSICWDLNCDFVVYDTWKRPLFQVSATDGIRMYRRPKVWLRGKWRKVRVSWR